MARRKTMHIPKKIKREVLHELYSAITKSNQVGKSCEAVSDHFLDLGFTISPQTLEKYWEKRREWLSDVYDISDADFTGRDLLAQLTLVISEMWTIYTAPASSQQTKLNALKEIRDTIAKGLEKMQDLGFIARAGDNLGNLTMAQVDTFVKIIETAFSDKPEIKEAIAQALLDMKGAEVKDMKGATIDVRDWR